MKKIGMSAQDGKKAMTRTRYFSSLNIADYVPIPLLCVELDSKSSGVPDRVCGSFFAANSRETRRNLSYAPNTMEQVCGAYVGDIVGYKKLTKGSCSFGVDNSLWDSLALEVGEQVDKI